MSESEYYVPFYKTCPTCNGRGHAEVPVSPGSCFFDTCTNCNHTGMVKVLIELEEYADLTGMSEEALHNLKCGLGEA